VAWGGSMTLEEIGLIQRLKEGNYQVIDRDTAKSQEERFFPDASGAAQRCVFGERECDE